MSKEMDTQYIAEVVSQMLRRQVDCDKLQYTHYGKCVGCVNSELCEKISWVI